MRLDAVGTVAEGVERARGGDTSASCSRRAPIPTPRSQRSRGCGPATPDIPIVVIVDHAAQAVARATLEHGAHGCVRRDELGPGTLERAVGDAAARSRSERQVALWALHDALTGLPNRRLMYQLVGPRARRRRPEPAVRRPRRLQGGQRQPRARGRRRGARDRLRAHRPRAAPVRPRGAARRRRVRHPLPGPDRPRCGARRRAAHRRGDLGAARAARRHGRDLGLGRRRAGRRGRHAREPDRRRRRRHVPRQARAATAASSWRPTTPIARPSRPSATSSAARSQAATSTSPTSRSSRSRPARSSPSRRSRASTTTSSAPSRPAASCPRSTTARSVRASIVSCSPRPVRRWPRSAATTSRCTSTSRPPRSPIAASLPRCTPCPSAQGSRSRVFGSSSRAARSREDAHTGTAVAALRALGAQVVADDLGAGGPTLAVLARTPFDLLKLDRSLVASVDADDRARAVATAVVALGSALGLQRDRRGRRARPSSSRRCASSAAISPRATCSGWPGRCRPSSSRGCA